MSRAMYGFLPPLRRTANRESSKMREIAATRGGRGAVHEWAAEAIQSCGQIVELIVCQRLIDGCKPSAYMAAMIKSFRHKGLKAL